VFIVATTFSSVKCIRHHSSGKALVGDLGDPSYYSKLDGFGAWSNTLSEKFDPIWKEQRSSERRGRSSERWGQNSEVFTKSKLSTKSKISSKSTVPGNVSGDGESSESELTLPL